MADEWICTECNHQNPDAMHFCPQCGAKKTPEGASNKPDLSTHERGWLQKNRRLLWIAVVTLWSVGCGILLVVGGIWLGQRTENSEKTTIAEITPQPETHTVKETATTHPSNTPLPTSTKSPLATPTPTPEERDDEKANDTSNDEGAESDVESQSDTSSGDRLVLPTDTPTPIPEGAILFLSSRDHDPQTDSERKKAAQNRYLELYLMKPDSSDQIRLSDGSREWWNGEANIVSYHIPNQVVINGKYVFDLTTRQVVDEIKLEFKNSDSSTTLRALFPTWLPSGEIAFFGGGTDSGIYYLENSQNAPIQLTDPPDNAWGDGWPAWSPDGQWIAFSRVWHDDIQDGIWLMKPDGSELHQILAMDTRRIFWSPDGNTLAFEGPKENTQVFSFETWIMEASGGTPRQLTSQPSDSRGALEPKWSPDGTRIVFQDAFDRGHIFTIDAEGSEPQQLTTIGDNNLAPLWLPISSDDLLEIYDAVASAPTPTPTATPKPAPAAVAPAPKTCPSPGVQITSPRSGTRFTSRTNYIVGTANINRFHHWKIEYSTDPNGGWQYLLERDYPVENDKLVMIDASTIPRGPYGLRLTVVEDTGNYPEPCEVWFTNGY